MCGFSVHSRSGRRYEQVCAGFFLWVVIFLCSSVTQAQDLARYKPDWIRLGFADGGMTHEPWIFLVRRNGESESDAAGTKEEYEYYQSEPYIKALAEAGATVYHLFCYKGFGFAAEKAHMDDAARAAAIAHRYGLKVDTYIQWNTMFYETFFAEVPEAETDQWYDVNVDGTPITLDYAYQPYRYRVCFNHDGYMEYFKEKILRYAVEIINTDFINFDNFNFNNPRDVQSNPATIKAFRRYLMDKYTPAQRIERFGFADLSHARPPMWNAEKSSDDLVVLIDPIMQEWCDFRCWTFATRLAECARFVRSLNKEIVIEINPGGLDKKSIWDKGVNHPELLQYTNVIWTEGHETARWGDGMIIGKWRNYKMGRTLDNFILSYKTDSYAYAENLAWNRTMSWLGLVGIPEGVTKQYLDFWHAHRDLYLPATGMERVAVLRSYPSMAYNLGEVHTTVQAAEQVLHQRQIPFDIIFDQHLEQLDKYSVMVLANQESLSDKALASIKRFVQSGGGLVVSGTTGKFDHWRRLRPVAGLAEIFNGDQGPVDTTAGAGVSHYGEGTAVYLPTVSLKDNASEFVAAVDHASKTPLPLRVSGPEWLGVSHDRQENRQIVHLVNYHHEQPAVGVTLTCEGRFKSAWAVSPDRADRMILPVETGGNYSIIRVPRVAVYEVVVLEP